MLDLLRTLLPERSPFRLLYHKISAMLAAICYLFPSRRITVIGVTGTSGKSTTVELIHHILQANGKKTGSLSTIRFHIGETELPNHSLRTTLRPWTIQKMITQMIRSNCEYVVMEVSSHAIDQFRTWGIHFDTMVVTNVFENEHLDYHETFADYLQTKLKPFQTLHTKYRKVNTPKTIIVGKDHDHAEPFLECLADKQWTFSRRTTADLQAKNITYSPRSLTFSLRAANNQTQFDVPMVGAHNLENILAAVTTGLAHGVGIEDAASVLKKIRGIPGRLEILSRDEQKAAVIVDFSYKPSALQATLKPLKDITDGRLIVVWGGAGGRAVENWEASAEILDTFADEIVLTTDDPGRTDPKEIAEKIRGKINRTEGDGFFEIEDRYEAIRYAIYSADPRDTVLIAGRGHETTQVIGNQKIDFDDRIVAREILDYEADFVEK